MINNSGSDSAMRSSLGSDTRGQRHREQDAERDGNISEDTATSTMSESQEKSTATDGPPDGGAAAWTHAFLMHIVFFNTWGVANGFGIFQEYYTKTLGETQSSISWIGSVQVFLLFSIGVVTGKLTDAGYFRITFAIGVALQLLGIFMTSLCTSYWQIFLAQAVCVGFGNGFTFCPALTILSQYFDKRRAFAVGLAAAGAAVGGLVYPILIDRLINHENIGFAWTLRAMGLVMLVTYIPCLIWFRPRVAPQSYPEWIDRTAFTDLPFIFFSLSMFFTFWGLYFGFFYLGTFARDVIGISQPIYVLMVLNGIGIIGRIAPTIFADKWFGKLNTLIPISVCASVLVYCWAAVTSTVGLYVFAVIYGFLAAASQALFPAAATTMTPHPSKTGVRVGMILSFVSIANLTGPAISGALIERQNGRYIGAQVFAGTSILLGALMAVASRVALAGPKLKVKV